MKDTSDEVRKLIIDAYLSGSSGSYENTAEIFGVSRSTVSRILAQFRRTGDSSRKKRGGNNPRAVDLEWLKKHAEENPDARLDDRIADWFKHSGRKVCNATMSNSMRAIGWTYKKNSARKGVSTS